MPATVTKVVFSVNLIYSYSGTQSEGHATFAGPFFGDGHPDNSDDYTIDMPYNTWKRMGEPTQLQFSISVEE